ncbi:type-1 restriction enzyme EcoKI specificity protein [Clostridium acetireducens DSM 10703]|uniref:Type-1 restriction enzyme EcoKI specificity protein n=1 Tax=Clostridium acetireducens DSM 10703 TaxID=1121290 RepID=A0A1E8F1V9_9CLOT|nr:restriction endonuclease subunit S [Clostridium acetireducens]OFI07631.1 type-1 restriction enzyme EcoKI specificity protein [Clostridium acetireducens DSM 10703]
MLIRYKIYELGEILTGNTPSKKNNEFYDSKDIMFIKPDDINNNITEIEHSKQYISNKAEKKARIVPKDSLLITCIGSIGKIAINKEKAAFNQQINSIIHNKKIISSKYLAYVLMVNKQRLEAIANAPVVPIINKTQFSEFQVDIHEDKEEQKKIVEVLEQAQSLIDKRKAQIEALDELIKSRFIEMFGDPASNPKGWNKDTIGGIVKSITAGWSANGEAREKREGEKAVLKVSAVTQGYFKSDEYKVISDAVEIKKYVFPEKGDLLFSRANTREMVGATCIIHKDYPDLLLPDKLWKVLFVDRVNVFYMKYILSESSIRAEFSAQSTGTSGSMYNVSMDKFKNIEIPVPPIELQNQFADFVKQVDKLKFEMENSLKELEDNFNSLMQKAFNGELFN